MRGKKSKRAQEQSFSQRYLKVIGHILFATFCISILALSIRGIPGNPTDADLNTLSWKDGGPLELSPERGRYALLYSMAENHSFVFTDALAQFAAPDVAFTAGKYVSLFAPGVSFLALPGYMLGKHFGLAQVGSFAVIAFFAILNVYLIRAIAIRLGAHPLAGTIASLAFIFASPAFSYAVTLYQHHISTFLILFSIYLLLRFNGVWSLIAVWILCAFSIVVDYPNFFLMAPIGIFALGKTIVLERRKGAIDINIPVLRVIAIFSVVIPLLFFFWFNKTSYGNPYQLSGTLERVIEVNAKGKAVFESDIVKARAKINPSLQIPKKSALGFFQNRNLMTGFQVLFLSTDRGLLVYTPIMLFGILGLILAINKQNKYISLFVAILGINILLYAMWDDPYGGWAFGARYLIPAYALLSIYIAIALSYLNKYNVFLLLFFIIFSYSVGVNTMGAITSNRNPPKVEADALEKVSHVKEEYTFIRNLNQLNDGKSKSYVYQTYAQNYISAWNYYTYITLFIIIVSAFLVLYYKESAKGENYAL